MNIVIIKYIEQTTAYGMVLLIDGHEFGEVIPQRQEPDDARTIIEVIGGGARVVLGWPHRSLLKEVNGVNDDASVYTLASFDEHGIDLG